MSNIMQQAVDRASTWIARRREEIVQAELMRRYFEDDYTLPTLADDVFIVDPAWSITCAGGRG